MHSYGPCTAACGTVAPAHYHRGRVAAICALAARDRAMGTVHDREAEQASAEGEVTALLAHARGGDDSAWNRVVQLLYADLKRLARRAGARADLQEVTELVHDCYLRLERGGAAGIENRGHFLALAATAMRQLLINHARDRLAAKRGGAAIHTTLGSADLHAAEQVRSEAEELLAIDAALERLARIDARLVRVAECRLFAGMSEAETATALGLPLRSTQRLWQRARRCLCESSAGSA